MDGQDWANQGEFTRSRTNFAHSLSRPHRGGMADDVYPRTVHIALVGSRDVIARTQKRHLWSQVQTLPVGGHRSGAPIAVYVLAEVPGGVAHTLQVAGDRRSCSPSGLLRNFDQVPFVSHLWVVTLRPVSMLTLAGPHSGTSAEPSVNSIPKRLRQ